MSFDPVVFTLPTPPPPPVNIPRPKFIPDSTKRTKIIASVSAIVIALSMISFALFTALTNNPTFKKAHGIKTAVEEQTVDTTVVPGKSAAALPGGGEAVGKGGTSGTNSPVVTLTADPAAVAIGGKSTLTWTVTNNPKSCVASDDWSGDKNVAGGSEITGALTISQSYIFTLTCKTATGTGFSSVSVGTIEQGGSGGLARPTVTLSATPSAVYVGQSSTLVWSVSNTPTSCVASGDWTGSQRLSGQADSGILVASKTYSYTLTCYNSAGSSFATTTVKATQPPPGVPIPGLSSNPSGPVVVGTVVSLTWSFMPSSGTPTSCTASGDWSGSRSVGGGTVSLGALTIVKSYSYKIDCANSAGTNSDTATIIVVPSPPTVSLTLSPSSIYVGNSATLRWTTTGSPTSCTAVGTWAGTTVSTISGSTWNTGVINTPGTYSYNIFCSNAGGTAYGGTGTTNQNNINLTVSMPPLPIVTITASPLSATVGGSSSITWSSTNATNCTATGDWSGVKATSGTLPTGTLTIAKNYSYSMFCSNASGNGPTSVTGVAVSAGGGVVVPPVVTISLAQSTIATGGSTLLSWSVTSFQTCTASGAWTGAEPVNGSQNTGIINTPGTLTYTLTCSNSAGSNSKSAVLTVIAAPVVSLTLSATSITAGGSSNLSWSSTNTPAGSTCTASGTWTGSKAITGGGPLTTGIMSVAGTFPYTLTCTNTGGSGSATVVLTVVGAAPVFCTGLSPCYGISEMATRAVVGNCWGWNDPANGTVPWVINITTFRPNHIGGTSIGSLETPLSTCNKNIFAILAGTASISGYKDAGGNTTHAHVTATKTNNASSGLKGSTFHVGYYDPLKP